MNVPPGPPPPQPKPGKSAVWVIVIVLGVLGMCCVTGVVAAIAVPNFIKFKGKSKQGECRSQLFAIYQAERVFFEANRRYSTNFNELGVTPTRNHYTYFIGNGSVKEPSARDSTPVSIDALPALAGGAIVGVEGECPDCVFTAACAINLDGDPELDVWSISSGPRGTVQPGELSHDAEDVK